MTDLVLATMAGLLGASTLAIILLYRGWKSNRKLITDLKAQVAVQQITALTGGAPVSTTPETDDQEPARRKGHLALYIGGGVAAAFWTIGDRIRSAWRRHRALTVTAATVATVSTVAAIYLAPTGDSSPTSEDSPGIAAVPDYSPGRAGSPDNGDLETEDQGPTVPFVTSSMELALTDEPDEDTGTPSSSSSDGPDTATEDPGPAQTEEVPEDAAQTPPWAPGGQAPEPQPAQRESPAPDPTPNPDPTPSPEPIGKPPKGDDNLLCLDLPPLLDLCLL